MGNIFGALPIVHIDYVSFFRSKVAPYTHHRQSWTGRQFVKREGSGSFKAPVVVQRPKVTMIINVQSLSCRSKSNRCPKDVFLVQKPEFKSGYLCSVNHQSILMYECLVKTHRWDYLVTILREESGKVTCSVQPSMLREKLCFRFC